MRTSSPKAAPAWRRAAPLARWRRAQSEDGEPSRGPGGITDAESSALANKGIALGEALGRNGRADGCPIRGVDGEGRDVVVRVIEPPERGARAMRRLAALRDLRHSGIARIRSLVPLAGGRLAVVTDLIDGADLAVVLGSRGRLGRGESAALLDGVGSALAALHDEGLVHGDVSAANVMIASSGAPVLIDLLGGIMEMGTQGTAAPERLAGGAATPSSDVYSLAALVLECQGADPSSRGEAASLLADALREDARARPTARDLAARAPQLGWPEAIDLPEGARLASGALRSAARTPTRVVPSRRSLGSGGGGRLSLGRKATALAAGGAVLALGVAGVMAWAGRGDDAGAPAPSAGPGVAPVSAGDESLEAVVTGLVAARDSALVSGDEAALALTSVEGSPAARADSELLASLRDGGERVAGLTTSVTGVSEMVGASCPDRQWEGARCARVSLSQGPTTWTGDDGAHEAPAPGAREVVLVLVPGPWRVAEVLEAG
ncbi:serine/threonine-protein kinase [Actinomyces sp. zg296]|uniref:serine/threonine-protein kinase n=1 Tax=Actinomyces sp. zg296 TaxID=2609289 RepID=UPI00135B92D8|nr:protein kinase [Actinomyces sp. zg296]